MGDRETPAGILRQVERLARDKLGWQGTLEPGMHLVEDLELDSLRNLTLAIEIENHFRIALDEEDEATIETVGDLIDVIAVKQRAGAKLPIPGARTAGNDAGEGE